MDTGFPGSALGWEAEVYSRASSGWAPRGLRTPVRAWTWGHLPCCAGRGQIGFLAAGARLFRAVVFSS